MSILQHNFLTSFQYVLGLEVPRIDWYWCPRIGLVFNLENPNHLDQMINFFVSRKQATNANIFIIPLKIVYYQFYLTLLDNDEIRRFLKFLWASRNIWTLHHLLILDLQVISTAIIKMPPVYVVFLCFSRSQTRQQFALMLQGIINKVWLAKNLSSSSWYSINKKAFCFQCFWWIFFSFSDNKTHINSTT